MDQPLQVLLSSLTNEWFTPPWIIEAARRVLGEIDLDPASCELANWLVGAKEYYTREQDGLHLPWTSSVWLDAWHNNGKAVKICHAKPHQTPSVVVDVTKPFRLLLSTFTPGRTDLADCLAAAVHVCASPTSSGQSEWHNEKELPCVGKPDGNKPTQFAPDAVRPNRLPMNTSPGNPRCSQDSIPGARSVSESMRENANGKGGAIPSCEANCSQRKVGLPSPIKDGPPSENNHESITTNGFPERPQFHTTGQTLTGNDVLPCGETLVRTAELPEGLHRTISSLYPAQLAQGQYQPTWCQLARLVTTLREIGTHMSGAPTQLAWQQYETTSPPYLMAEYPSRVWVNPPYGKTKGRSNQEIWADKLLEQYGAGTVPAAIMLTRSAPGYSWWEDLFAARPVCLLRERVRFWKIDPDSSDSYPTLMPGGQAKHGTSLWYFGDKPGHFYEVFEPYGRVIQPTTWVIP